MSAEGGDTLFVALSKARDSLPGEHPLYPVLRDLTDRACGIEVRLAFAQQQAERDRKVINDALNRLVKRDEPRNQWVITDKALVTCDKALFGELYEALRNIRGENKPTTTP